MNDLQGWVKIIQRLTHEEALVYDGNETLSVTHEQADALADFGLIRYSPEDGPNGIVFRPAPDVSIDRIKRALI